MPKKYIDAEEAISTLKRLLYETAINNNGIPGDDFSTSCVEIADNRIESWIGLVPAADVVERKKGKWLGKPIVGWATVRCSVCKTVFCENSGRWNFCPACGADMMEGKDNDR